MLLQKLKELGANPWRGDTFQPFSEKEVKEVETQIKANLPASYREMLSTLGGVFFSEAVYYVDPKENVPEMFGGFYGFDELINATKYLDNLPPGIIPIGDDGGGNLYCLGVKGDDVGKVFFHDHGVGWDDEAWSCLERGEELPLHLRYQTVCLLANTLDEFVNSMSVGEE